MTIVDVGNNMNSVFLLEGGGEDQPNTSEPGTDSSDKVDNQLEDEEEVFQDALDHFEDENVRDGIIAVRTVTGELRAAINCIEMQTFNAESSQQTSNIELPVSSSTISIDGDERLIGNSSILNDVASNG
ncbi:MAG: hypothetical protein ACN4GM_02325 [Gammaproteobacteria bacterium]